jgi:hypothetical protein
MSADDQMQRGAPLPSASIKLNGTAPTGQNLAAYVAFLRRLGELGWTDGRNVRIEVRWANSDPELMRSYPRASQAAPLVRGGLE